MEIIYQDENLFIVNKPSGIASIPERAGSAQNMLAVMQEQTGEKVFVVHRLDKEVSGALLFAKNPQTHRDLCGLFERREITKHYLALLHGLPYTDNGEINLPLKQFGSGRVGVSVEGKACKTLYTVLRRWKFYALADVQIITGRRHQIRAHFYAIAHAIVGDTRYGDKNLQAHFPRLMLHSHEMEFQYAGKTIKVTVPPPELFETVIKQITDGAFDSL